MDRNALQIIQEGALGDILFIQKLCKILHESYEVYHPVHSHLWVAGASRLITPVNCGPSLHMPAHRYAYDCSAQMQGRKHPEEVMTCKYDGAGIDWKDWADYLEFKRDLDREKALFSSLDLSEDEPYIVANKNWSFHKIHHGIANTIPSDYDGKVVWMDPFKAQSIFDW